MSKKKLIQVDGPAYNGTSYLRLIYVRESAPTIQINTSLDIVQYMERYNLQHDPREQMWALYLNNRHRLITAHQISIGTQNSAPASPSDVFGPALVLCARSLVLCHNHPSGDCTPSADDRLVTERLMKIGELHDITLLDHIILGDSQYFSFAEDGIRHLS